ncbi:MAG: glycyl-radical enzyme activating protein [Candidatus Riflebacteria bacterium]|nr:glycyl-radical enzyme activating protein [Candidatus Riflebacteria bacterium]
MTSDSAGPPTDGMIFNVQRFSTGDGPGIRTTVFFKGCPLRCAWCHNPEGLRPGPDLMWHEVRCIAHRACLAACAPAALELTEQGMRIDRDRCDLCGKCARACPAAAIEVVGRRRTPESLLEEALRDRVFYETSGGGVTVSGGEPMQQPDFLAAFLRLCRGAGLHTAVDTCGAAPWDRYEAILPLVDLVMLDLKIMDDARHREVVGASNATILENARRLAERGAPIWVRTPVIPGYTDGAANIAEIGRFIRDALGSVVRWDLLAYTNLGRPKSRRLDMPYAPGEAPLLTRDQMDSVHRLASSIVPVARWSGATRG